MVLKPLYFRPSFCLSAIICNTADPRQLWACMSSAPFTNYRIFSFLLFFPLLPILTLSTLGIIDIICMFFMGLDCHLISFVFMTFVRIKRIRGKETFIQALPRLNPAFRMEGKPSWENKYRHQGMCSGSLITGSTFFSFAIPPTLFLPSFLIYSSLTQAHISPPTFTMRFSYKYSLFLFVLLFLSLPPCLPLLDSAWNILSRLILLIIIIIATMEDREMGIGRKRSAVKMEKETGFDGFKDLMGKVQAKEWHGMAWRG